MRTAEATCLSGCHVIKSERREMLALALVFGYAAAALALFPKWTVDDAFITFRYAENLAVHGELNWNPGEPPVEGYTGIALPVLIAGAIKVGFSPVAASRAIGIASYFLIAIFAFAAMRSLRIRATIRVAAIAVLCGAPLLLTHALSGLETLLFAAAVVAALACFLHAIQSENNWLKLDALLFGVLLAASLIRPEGAALAAACAVALFIARWRQSRKNALQTAAVFFEIYFLSGAVYFLWRWSTYGRLLPNTFYAKLDTGEFDGRTMWNFIRFAYTYLAAPAIAAALVYFFGSRGNRQSIHTRSSFVPVFAAFAAFTVAVLALYARSTLMMNYSHRFYVPFFPIFLVGLASVAETGTQRFAANSKSASQKPAVISLASLALVQSLIYVLKWQDEVDYVTEYRAVLEDGHMRAARFIDENIPESESIVCYMDAGVIPYMTKRRAVDFGRLNDSRLARPGVTTQDAMDYFFSQNAGAVVFTSRDWNRVDYTDEAAAIVGDPRFQRYSLMRKFRTDRTAIKQRYHQFVFLRNDLIEPAAVGSREIDAHEIDAPDQLPRSADVGTMGIPTETSGLSSVPLTL